MSLFHITLADMEAAVNAGDFRKFKQLTDGHINFVADPTKSNLIQVENSVKEYYSALSILNGMTTILGPSKNTALTYIGKARLAADKMKDATEALLKREFRISR